MTKRSCMRSLKSSFVSFALLPAQVLLAGCGTSIETLETEGQGVTVAPPPGKVNVALGASTAGSSRGWGGGSYPDDMVDGHVAYTDTWAHGLAFTGGPKRWMDESCGERQAVVTFDSPKKVDMARVWHHGTYADHLPTVYRLEIFDGTAWQPAGGTSTARLDLDSGGSGAWGAIPTEHVFPAVEATAVRFVLNNCSMVGDGHGWIYEFQVFGTTLEIADLALNDIDNGSLQYLSTDEHSYFGGNTRVHGKMSIHGTPGDVVTHVGVEVLEAGTTVASADLAAAASAQLLAPFGPNGELAVTTSRLLFELPSNELAALDDGANGEVSFRIKVSTSSGGEATRDAGPVAKLVRYDGTNRYGSRDGTQGGDDWIKPNVRPVLEALAGVSWGDMSNMNGGPFPPHGSHDTGNDADGWVPAYAPLNGAGNAVVPNQRAAQALIGILNTPNAGSRITDMFVSDAPGHAAFWQVINTTTLQDGRAARNVIRRHPGHRTHFHIRVAE